MAPVRVVGSLLSEVSQEPEGLGWETLSAVWAGHGVRT